MLKSQQKLPKRNINNKSHHSRPKKGSATKTKRTIALANSTIRTFTTNLDTHDDEIDSHAQRLKAPQTNMGSKVRLMYKERSSDVVDHKEIPPTFNQPSKHSSSSYSFMDNSNIDSSSDGDINHQDLVLREKKVKLMHYELGLRERELQLKENELDLKSRELQFQQTANKYDLFKQYQREFELFLLTKQHSGVELVSQPLSTQSTLSLTPTTSTTPSTTHPSSQSPIQTIPLRTSRDIEIDKMKSLFQKNIVSHRRNENPVLIRFKLLPTGQNVVFDVDLYDPLSVILKWLSESSSNHQGEDDSADEKDQIVNGKKNANYDNIMTFTSVSKPQSLDNSIDYDSLGSLQRQILSHLDEKKDDDDTNKNDNDDVIEGERKVEDDNNDNNSKTTQPTIIDLEPTLSTPTNTPADHSHILPDESEQFKGIPRRVPREKTQSMEHLGQILANFEHLDQIETTTTKIYFSTKSVLDKAWVQVTGPGSLFSDEVVIDEVGQEDFDGSGSEEDDGDSLHKTQNKQNKQKKLNSIDPSDCDMFSFINTRNSVSEEDNMIFCHYNRCWMGYNYEIDVKW